MKEFIYVRHGETEANAKGLMCGGAWDIELSAKGIEQATAARSLIHLHSPNLKLAFVSPLKRAVRTAEIILDGLTQLKVEHVPELREWEMGKWDRVPFEQVKHEFLGSAEPEGGETRVELKKRVASALELCLAPQDQKIIIAHGAVWIAVQEILGIPAVHMANCVPHLCFQTSVGWKAEKLK